MAVRATSPTRTPSGERSKRSRSRASERTLAVEQRRRETYNRSSSESAGSLQRLRAEKAKDASLTPTRRGRSSERPRRAKSTGAGRGKGGNDDNNHDEEKKPEGHDVASRSGSSGRRRRKKQKGEDDEKPSSRHGSLSSDKPETVQCKQCGSYCKGEAGLKMHMAYSKKCLAYGYWNKGKKPWDKCLTLANKEWQVRERRERQSRSQVSDRNPATWTVSDIS